MVIRKNAQRDSPAASVFCLGTTAEFQRQQAQAAEEMRGQQENTGRIPRSLTMVISVQAEEAVQTLLARQGHRQHIEMQRQEQRQSQAGNPVQDEREPKRMGAMRADHRRRHRIDAPGAQNAQQANTASAQATQEACLEAKPFCAIAATPMAA